MNKQKIINTSNVWILSFMHLLVDGLCAYTIFNRLYITDQYIEVIIVFVVYNSLAFMLQPLVGFIIDKVKKEKMFLDLSVIMLIMGSLLPLYKWITLPLIGISNAIFHVVGGKYTVYANSQKLSPLGLFVALGATGLAIGTYVNYKIVQTIFAVLFLVLNFIFHMINSHEETASSSKEAYHPIKEIPSKAKKWVLILSLAVTIRALMGKVSTPLFEVNTLILVLIGIATSLGKIIGGVLADKIGIRMTVFITLPISFVLYLLFRDNLVTYIIATILFNTTMPITLYLANVNFKNHEGLSFGILAFTLFPGYLLGSLYQYLELPYIPLLVIAIILTMFIILRANHQTTKRGPVYD